MRVAQRVRVKERERLLAVRVVEYKQPHPGFHQVSSSLYLLYSNLKARVRVFTVIG